jgi:hypothetical protein
MPDLGLSLPAGHQLVSFTERPDLVRAALSFNSSVWPEFMLQDPVTDEHWHLLWEAWADFQLTLLTPIDRYARWTRTDGEPFDAWVRLHVRLGGRIVGGVERSMTMRGTVAEWESWTGMPFPDTGRYIVPLAIAPVDIDRESDTGVYHDPNV